MVKIKYFGTMTEFTRFDNMETNCFLILVNLITKNNNVKKKLNQKLNGMKNSF